MRKVKIGIVGIGNVGSHVLYTLALQGLADEFVLIDINEKKAAADRQDTFDSAMFLPHKVKITVAHVAELIEKHLAENAAGDSAEKGFLDAGQVGEGEKKEAVSTSADSPADVAGIREDIGDFALLSDCDIIIKGGALFIFSVHGYDWGNVYTDDLHHILRDGEMMKLLRLSVGEMKDRSPDCRECEWKKLCNFGCRAEACAQGNGIEGIDQRMCIFFKDGYYDRLRAIAKKYGIEIEA